MFIITEAPPPVQPTLIPAPVLQLIDSTSVRVSFQDTSGQPYQFYVIQYRMNSNTQFLSGNVINYNGQRSYTNEQGGLVPGNTYVFRVAPYTATRAPGTPSASSSIFVNAPTFITREYVLHDLISFLY